METVGGYRLVRMLGAGERAQIHLGHAGAREPPESRRIAAIKIFRPSTDEGSIDREIEALARASSRHLLELRDLAAGPDGRPCLILPRLGSGSLARLLALRGTIEPGEAVTLLVPLVGAIRELHRVGVSHGRVRTSSVLFDDRGAPVLARFGEASLIGPFPATDGGQSRTPAQLDDDPRVREDRRGIATLTGAVLDRLTDDGAPGALSALRRLLEEVDTATADLERLTSLLFELAPALPLRFDDGAGQEREPMLPGAAVSGAAGSGAADPLLPAMSIRPDGRPGARGDAEGVDAEGFDAERFDAEGFDVEPAGSGGSAGSRLARLRATVVRLLAPVRTSVWVAGGAGVGALVVALTVVPAANSRTAPPAPSTGPHPNRPPHARARGLPRRPGMRRPGTGRPAPRRPSPERIRLRRHERYSRRERRASRRGPPSVSTASIRRDRPCSKRIGTSCAGWRREPLCRRRRRSTASLRGSSSSSGTPPSSSSSLQTAASWRTTIRPRFSW
jgi:hypothetical protein